ncbi:MAG: esterase family protein [Dysgonamonadaceae bacterium]|jgi:enterochelin esterase-like enzyme|nr:esterase family protein [Dysgonamonadaceae bacterium]
MKRITLLLLLTVFTVSGASAQFGDWGPQSKVETKTFHSTVLDADRDYNIFIPKSYGTDINRKYPVLYLLHGMMDTHSGWNGRGHVKDVMDQLTASGEAAEMIIVTPDAGGNVYEGAWNGYFDMPGWKYETFFFTEFLPYIESEYRIIGDKQHRAVAGLSMGGGGATAYGQKHSDLFSSVYAMSALMNIPEQGAAPSQRPDDKMAILNKSVKENNCIKYVADADEATKEKLRTIAWFVDCGDDDFLLERNIEFIQAMRQAQIPCQFRVRDGGHTWEYWHSALYTCLTFITRIFEK